MLWRVCLGHENISVRQDVEPARMVEAGGKRVDRKTRSGGRSPAVLPGARRRDIDGRDQRLARRRDFGVGALRLCSGNSATSQEASASVSSETAAIRMEVMTSTLRPGQRTLALRERFHPDLYNRVPFPVNRAQICA